MNFGAWGHEASLAGGGTRWLHPGACGWKAGVGSDLLREGGMRGEWKSCFECSQHRETLWWLFWGCHSQIPPPRQRGSWGRSVGISLVTLLLACVPPQMKKKTKKIGGGVCIWEAVFAMLLYAWSMDYVSPVEDAELQPDPSFVDLLPVPSRRWCQRPSVSRRPGPEAAFCEGMAWGCFKTKTKRRRGKKTTPEPTQLVHLLIK